MNATQFIAVTRKSLGIESDEPKPDKPTMDTAWIVLEAANDLGDDATVAARRRVIDANFSGALAAQSDCISPSIFSGDYRPALDFTAASFESKTLPERASKRMDRLSH
jgi:hypothetical protein